MTQDGGEYGGGFWIAFGLALVVIFLAIAVITFTSWRRLHTWTQVDATVTKVKKQKEKDSENVTTTTRVAHYTFVDASGQTRAGIDRRGGKRRRGEVVRVVYDPERPDLNETASLRWLLVLLAVFALPFLLGLYALQWGLADLLGSEPLVEVPDPRLLWLEE